MHITTVLFDAGSTLVHSKDPWPPIYEQADRALIEVLHQAGFQVDPATFFTEGGGFIRSYYEIPPIDNLEKTSFTVLRNWMIKNGFSSVTESTLRAGLKAMYAITQKNWYNAEDTIPTLEKLKSLGYRMGIISNTSDDGNVQTIVDQWGLRPFFDTIITSAALGIRKPDPRIFKVALDHLQVQPQAAAMVGDTLEADILGANLLGIYSIWITNLSQLPGEGELTIRPQAIISALKQIPDLLAEIESETS